MTTTISEIYDALMAAGAPETKRARRLKRLLLLKLSSLIPLLDSTDFLNFSIKLIGNSRVLNLD
ncbi:MAG: hypothetical protein J2P49_02190 [Methylocapsa sp.]|nr:hypothetical protein [Methylocapsa sp.]